MMQRRILTSTEKRIHIRTLFATTIGFIMVANLKKFANLRNLYFLRFLNFATFFPRLSPPGRWAVVLDGNDVVFNFDDLHAARPSLC